MKTKNYWVISAVFCLFFKVWTKSSGSLEGRMILRVMEGSQKSEILSWVLQNKQESLRGRRGNRKKTVSLKVWMWLKRWLFGTEVNGTGGGHQLKKGLDYGSALHPVATGSHWLSLSRVMTRREARRMLSERHQSQTVTKHTSSFIWNAPG